MRQRALDVENIDKKQHNISFSSSSGWWLVSLQLVMFQEVWLGHSLWDREATIIHHFASPQHFKYPHIASGVVFSTAILRRLSSRLEDETRPKTDFSIDPSHELSLYVWNKGRGTALSHSDLLCLHRQPHCASYVVPFQPC
ncbi:unnamed protein product, partial [Timema podura]|nr:unnamed protein product [Timema podura]